MKIKYPILSILLSVVTLVSIFIINYKIAVRFISATGKTKALFGLTELLTFGYKYYFLIPAVTALLLGAISQRRKQRFAITAIILGIMAISTIFLRFWIWMIPK